MSNKMTVKDRLKTYRKHPGSFLVMLLVMLGALLTFSVLLFLIAYILINGVPHIKLSLFEWNYTSENASVVPALINTIVMTILSLLIAVPFGIFSAIFLVEYSGKGNKFVEVIRLTTETLSGIPSIVYGLFGMLFFVNTLDWGFSILAGAFTLSIMILPLIMRTTEEALKSVPDSYREGSFGLGAGKLRTVFRIVLPSAVPGILAGVILAIGRIVGETAALIYTAGSVAQTKVWTDEKQGSYQASPYLISIPEEIDGSYIWDVVTKPKSEWITEAPQHPEMPDKNTETEKTEGAKTGDTSSAALSLLLLIFSSGAFIILCRKRRIYRKD